MFSTKIFLVFIILALPKSGNCTKIFVEDKNEGNVLVTCVTNIVEKYYQQKEITYVNMASDNDEIIKALHYLSKITIVSRNATIQSIMINLGYLINARTALDFITQLVGLRDEAKWNPSSRFTIVIELLDAKFLRKIFEKLLKFHVYNVIVINGTNEADIYTYNPFGKRGCGRHFDRVISFGKCATPLVNNFFPNKLSNGLRNCTMRVAVSHVPPLTFHPHKCNFTNHFFCFGIELYAIKLLSEIEGFNITAEYVDFAENFSTIDTNMRANGSFSLIQDNVTDALIGMSALTSERAHAFSYVFGHNAYTDELSYLVKRAGLQPLWKFVYMEFTTSVWLLLFLSFFCSCVLIILLARPIDKTAMILDMWDSLFLHGFNISTKFNVRIFFFIWICFASWINSFYQCSLMSLTTHPSKAYQISTEEDIATYKLRPCLQDSVRDILSLSGDMNFSNTRNDCQQFIQAIKKVGDTDGIYTILPLNIFEYNKHKFTDDNGELKLYPLQESVIKLIYPIYFYKGFPLTQKLQFHSLKLTEAGLIMKYREEIFAQQAMQNSRKTDANGLKGRQLVPWKMLAFGIVIASIVFILELLGKNTTPNVL